MALLAVMAQRSFVSLVLVGSKCANDLLNLRLMNLRNWVCGQDRILCKAIEVRSRQIEVFEPMNRVGCHRLVLLFDMRYEDLGDLFLQ